MRNRRTMMPAILIVSYGSPDLLRTCLNSVARFAQGCEVFVHDNLSDSSPQIRLLKQEFPLVRWSFGSSNIGFAAAVNLLVARTEDDFVLLNPDAELVDMVDDFFDFAQKSVHACCLAPGNASEDRYWDVAHRPSSLLRSLVSHAGYSRQLRGKSWSELYPAPPRDAVGYLGGAFLYVKRSVWAKIGSFDESFFLYSEEVDWQLRASQAGFGSYFFDSVKFRHSAQGTVAESTAGLSRSAELLRDSQTKFFSKHHGPVTARSFRIGLRLLDSTQRSKKVSKDLPSSCWPEPKG